MNQEHISQTALDQMVVTDYDQMIKAAVPYLPPNSRRILSIYEKTKELMNTLSLFGRPGAQMQICSAPQREEPMAVLDDIRQFCYGEAREKLDNLANMMAVLQMVQIMSQPISGKDEKNE